MYLRMCSQQDSQYISKVAISRQRLTYVIAYTLEYVRTCKQVYVDFLPFLYVYMPMRVSFE